jgi:hypothetical protein
MTAKGEPVQKPIGQTFIAQHRNPFAKGEIGGNNERGALRQMAATLEQELRPGW